MDDSTILWETGQDGRLVYWSQSGHRLLGVPSGRALGHAPDRLLRPQSRFAWPLSRRQPFAGKHLRWQLRNGRFVDLINNGKPFYDTQQRFCGFRGILRVRNAQQRDPQAGKRAESLEDFVERLRPILRFAQATRCGITFAVVGGNPMPEVLDDLEADALLHYRANCSWAVLPALSGGGPRQYQFFDRLADGSPMAILGEKPVRHADPVYWLCSVLQTLARSGQPAGLAFNETTELLQQLSSGRR